MDETRLQTVVNAICLSAADRPDNWEGYFFHSCEGYEAARDAIKAEVRDFVDSKDVDGHVSVVGLHWRRGGGWAPSYRRDPDRTLKVMFEYISIHNAYNGLSKRSWLNKVTVRQTNARFYKTNVRIRTDAKMIEPFPTEFTKFVVDMINAIDVELAKEAE